MKAVILLADSAQVDRSGKMHALGLGWSATTTPTAAAVVVVMIDIPWDQCNTKHNIKIELVDSDGRVANLGRDPGGNPMSLSVEAELEAGRPAGLPKGYPVRSHLALGVSPGMPLTPGAVYEYRLEINGEHQEGWSASFFVDR